MMKSFLTKMRFQKWYKSFLRNFIFKFISHDGVHVPSENWKYLIILDSCRYDTFKEMNCIPGKLEKKISKGSCTLEWLKKNFEGYYEDIIYISANPYISNVNIRGFNGSKHFFRIKKVWDFGWNETLGTVPPEEVTKTALEMKKKYPQKRMIIHYMQPHGLIKKGNVKLDDIKKAREDNLKLVLNEIKKITKKLEGKIVITSDHGECLGEKFIFGHPCGVYVKELVEIPWLEVKK